MRVAVVELGVNSGSGDDGSCFGIEVWTDTAKLANIVIARFVTFPHRGRGRDITTSTGLWVTSTGSTLLGDGRCGRDNPSRPSLLCLTNYRESSVVDKRVGQIRYPIGSKPFIPL